MIVMLADASSGFKAENDALTKKGKEVPNHQQLPTLDEIIKLQQAPRSNNNTAFTFVVEHLAGAVIGQRKWKITRCYAPLSKHMSISDEAFMLLLVLENQYELWMESETTRVGRGKYTENAPNKKFCGWSNKGMRRFNNLLAEVRINQAKQYSKEVENVIFKTLAERYKTVIGVRRKNSQKCRRRLLDDMGEEDEDDLDDSSSVIPEDELSFLLSKMAIRREV